MSSDVLEFLIPEETKGNEVVLVLNPIHAGFPSPADDFQEDKISLDKFLIKNKDATFYARVKGQSMIDAGFDEGDILIVDRSLEPTNEKIAVCFVDGEFTVKKVSVNKDGAWLIAYNKDFAPIKITEETNFLIWGMVTYIIKKVG